MKRPEIAAITSGAELRLWYWLKSELIEEARRVGVKSWGGKFDILDRLCAIRDGDDPPFEEKNRATFRFDWHSAQLSGSTLITDNYKNTQNVRRFFLANTDAGFKFNIALMVWMKANSGKTLADALDAHRSLSRNASQPGFQTRIKPHNQFNQYTRDFLADNPYLGPKAVRKFWELKRSLPSGDGKHIYDRCDLSLSDG